MKQDHEEQDEVKAAGWWLLQGPHAVRKSRQVYLYY